jgi:hypothetical protein
MQPGSAQSPGGPGIHGNDRQATFLIDNVTKGQCYRPCKVTMRLGEGRAQLTGNA